MFSLQSLTRASLFSILVVLSILTPSMQLSLAASTFQPTQQESRTEAERLMTEANKLRTTADGRPAAIEKFNAALQLWEKLGDRSKEAETKHWLCSTHNAMGERKQALSYCEQALAMRHELRDQRGEAETLNIIGNIQLALSGAQSALSFFERSLAIRRAIGDQRGMAVTLGNLARLYPQTGEYQKELEALREALPLARAAKDPALENNLLGLLANVHNRLGEVETARQYYQQSLLLSRSRDDKVNESGTLSNLGKLYYETGQKQLALNTLTDAIALHRLLKNPANEAATLTTLAGVWNSMGEAEKALPVCEEALKLAQKAGAGDYEFFALQTLAGIHHTLDNQQKALDYDQAALLLARSRGSKTNEAIILSRIAIDWLRLNDLPKALEFHQQAIALHRASGDQLQLMFALGELCKTQVKLGDHTSATAACRESLALSRSRRDFESQAKALARLAQMALDKGDLTESRSLLGEAIQLLELSSSELLNFGERASFLGFNHALYTDYIAVLMKQHQENPTQGFHQQALQTAERARARTLLAMLTEMRAELRQGVDVALLAREQELLRKLERTATEQNRQRSENDEQRKLSALTREITELSTEIDRVRAQIKQTSPRYAALVQPQPLNLSEMQKEVVNDANTILLEYALGEEKSWLWAVTATGMQSYELPKRAEIEAAARRVYELLTARKQRSKFEEDAERRARIQQADAEFPQAAAALSQMILAPVAAQLGTKRLLIVADGALQYVPFAALPMPEFRVSSSEFRRRGSNAKTAKPETRNPKPLIAHHEIVSLPSASTLAVLRRELAGRKPAPKSIAVIADPVFEKTDARLTNAIAQNAPSNTTRGEWWQSELQRSARDVGGAGERAGFARLPATRAEAQAAVKFAPAGSSFTALDFAANQTTATSEQLSQYRYVHFATHGVLNNEHPELSGLVLSLLDEKGNDTDGFLRLVEIYNLKLPAEMVVLSACRTGLGKEVKGEGLMSLTRGFMYAGAARVLVSLWDVNDASTAALMTRMYQSILQDKNSPAAALRQAQNALRQDKRYSAPYYWAAFTLHGEPR